MKLRLSTTAALFALTGAAVVSHSLAQDAADIDNAIQNHICPAAKIDTRQLPNFEPCKALEPQWSKVDACQNEEQHYANLAYEYNKIYVDCHKDAASTSSAKPSGGVPGKDGRRV